MIWENSIEKANHFQVRYSPRNGGPAWRFAKDSFKENFAIIRGLLTNTEYIFQVRGVFGDQKGQYGPESDCIGMKASPATVFFEIIQASRKI